MSNRPLEPRPSSATPVQGGAIPDRWAWSPLVVGALALVLFGVTAAPGVLWGDSAKLTLMALDVELLPQPGGHPTYVLLAAIWMMPDLGASGWRHCC